MSNRLESTSRLPLILDPDIAVRAGKAFTLTRAHAERVIRFGESVAESFGAIGDVFEALGRANDRALMAQRLSALSDGDLARRGLKRSEIPAAVWKATPLPEAA